MLAAASQLHLAWQCWARGGYSLGTWCPCPSLRPCVGEWSSAPIWYCEPYSDNLSKFKYYTKINCPNTPILAASEGQYRRQYIYTCFGAAILWRCPRVPPNYCRTTFAVAHRPCHCTAGARPWQPTLHRHGPPGQHTKAARGLVTPQARLGLGRSLHNATQQTSWPRPTAMQA